MQKEKRIVWMDLKCMNSIPENFYDMTQYTKSRQRELTFVS